MTDRLTPEPTLLEIVKTTLADLKGIDPDRCDHERSKEGDCSRCCKCLECVGIRAVENVMPALQTTISRAEETSTEEAGTSEEPYRITLPLNDLIIVRGALCEEIKRARQVPNGTGTVVYHHLASAYSKVIARLEELQPGRQEHAFHRAVLKDEENALY